MSFHRPFRLAPSIAAWLCAASLSGCALFGINPEQASLKAEGDAPRTSSVTGPEPKLPKTAAAAQRTQTAHVSQEDCVKESDCMAHLKRLVTESDRSWIARPVAPKVFANGTRLFAYRSLREQLSCRELALALAEIATTTKQMEHAGPDIAPARVEKVSLLAKEVASELSGERERRCTSEPWRIGQQG